ncbi:hypothetical protein [Pseudonocardia nigra]|uniref:hypothetical protein n=1 Tax=Pseudonocardia nigra TaxID=1921578 RepID=UPI001C5EAA51|nr:hypothetical protein [Pseudonocardia nigra]
MKDQGGRGPEHSETLRSKVRRRGLHGVVLNCDELVDAAYRYASDFSLVVDPNPFGLVQSRLLAAHLGVPLLTPDALDGTDDDVSSVTAPTHVQSVRRACHAISLAAAKYNDSALAQASITSLGPDPIALNLDINHRAVHLPRSEIHVSVHDDLLAIDAMTPSGVRRFRGVHCQIEPLSGRFLVSRDGTRRAELRGRLALRVWRRYVTTHVLTTATAASSSQQ